MTPFKENTSKEQLGQVLLQKGVITPEQLEQALKVQREKGGLLGEILTDLGFTQEEDIAQALAIQFDFPYLPLTNYDIDLEVVKLIPESLARKYFIVPIDRMGDILTVVMANPLEDKIFKEIEALTKCKMQPFIATYGEIREAIERCYTKKQSRQNGGS